MAATQEVDATAAAPAALLGVRLDVFTQYQRVLQQLPNTLIVFLGPGKQTSAPHT